MSGGSELAKRLLHKRTWYEDDTLISTMRISRYSQNIIDTPLFITAFIPDVELRRGLVDSLSSFNIMPLRLFEACSWTADWDIYFRGNASRILGYVSVDFAQGPSKESLISILPMLILHHILCSEVLVFISTSSCHTPIVSASKLFGGARKCI